MADEEVLFDDVYELCEIIGKWVHKAHFSFFYCLLSSTLLCEFWIYFRVGTWWYLLCKHYVCNTMIECDYTCE
jgi:hypothetical protein